MERALAASDAESVRLVVALTKARGTLSLQLRNQLSKKHNRECIARLLKLKGAQAGTQDDRSLPSWRRGRKGSILNIVFSSRPLRLCYSTLVAQFFLSNLDVKEVVLLGRLVINRALCSLTLAH